MGNLDWVGNCYTSSEWKWSIKEYVDYFVFSKFILLQFLPKPMTWLTIWKLHMLEQLWSQMPLQYSTRQKSAQDVHWSLGMELKVLFLNLPLPLLLWQSEKMLQGGFGDVGTTLIWLRWIRLVDLMGVKVKAEWSSKFHSHLLYISYFTPKIHYLLSSYYYQISCVIFVVLHVLSICHQDLEKFIETFLVYWIFTIFSPIFSIFLCFPLSFTLMYAIKLSQHTLTYHT